MIIKKMKKALFIALLVFICNPLFAADLNLSNDWDYEIDYSSQSIRVFGSYISNDSTSTTSGQLVLCVYLTEDINSSGSADGFLLAQLNLDPLAPGYSYESLDEQLDYNDTPPSGTRYVSFVLLEMTPEGAEIRNALYFEDPIEFGIEPDTQIMNQEGDNIDTINQNNESTQEEQNSDEGNSDYNEGVIEEQEAPAEL